MAELIGTPTTGEAAPEVTRGGGFERGIGLREAIAINMTQMCGIGPFVTIPLMIAALGGPQAVFGWHPRHHFPHVALLAMALVTAIGSFFTLATVIQVLLAVFVIVQALAQVIALTVLRRRQPDLPRPYRQWLYPVPSLLALIGWAYVYGSSGHTPIIFSIVILAAGLAAFFVWARAERQWPFGPKRIHEDFMPARPGELRQTT
jgi:uncharacterized membrane protein YhaH (DUF805 family)